MSTLSAEALNIFLRIMDNLKKDAGGDYAKCWEWPKTWPAHWGEKPKGYSISLMGEGYGQFSIPSITIKPYAHRLAYMAFNGELGTISKNEIAEISGEEVEVGIEYLGGLKEGDQVRHAHGCKKHCVNPLHLRKGKAAYNIYDNKVPDITNKPLSPRAEKCREAVLRLWKAPGGYATFSKHFGIYQWEVIAILHRYGGHSIYNLLEDNEQ